jgi:plastocyanin
MECLDFFPAGRHRRLPLWASLILAVVSAEAAELDVTVLDRYGRPVPNVAVFVHSEPDENPPLAVANPAVMNLIDMRFVPHMLVVQTGTRVQFPNSDVVAHHVYSFSSPNNFVLPMFRRNMTPHVDFDDAGVVAIGCNLHDQMVGYILVVDSPAFGTTGADGTTRLIAENPHGLSVSIWSPKMQRNDEHLTQTVKPGRSARLTFELTEELRASHDDQTAALSWHKY